MNHPAIDKFLELDAKRTPGEWHLRRNKREAPADDIVMTEEGDSICDAQPCSPSMSIDQAINNAAFIAAASALAPELRGLVEEVRGLRKAVELAAEMTRDLPDCAMSHDIFTKALERK